MSTAPSGRPPGGRLRFSRRAPAQRDRMPLTSRNRRGSNHRRSHCAGMPQIHVGGRDSHRLIEVLNGSGGTQRCSLGIRCRADCWRPASVDQRRSMPQTVDGSRGVPRSNGVALVRVSSSSRERVLAATASRPPLAALMAGQHGLVDFGSWPRQAGWRPTICRGRRH
jgi:hypothetical protein